MKISIKWLVYCLIGLCIAAFLGIALRMQFTLMFPVIIAAIIVLGIERMRRTDPRPTFKSAFLNGCLPVLIGGLYIQLCMLLELWWNV